MKTDDERANERSSKLLKRFLTVIFSYKFIVYLYVLFD